MYLQSMLSEYDKDGNPVNTPRWIDMQKEQTEKGNKDAIAWLGGHAKRGEKN